MKPFALAPQAPWRLVLPGLLLALALPHPLNTSAQGLAGRSASVMVSPHAHGSSRPRLHFDGKRAAAPQGLPLAVHRAVQAGNQLQGKPYRWGGGHRFLHDKGYDCSGSVSYILHMAGLLKSPMTSTGFTKYGHPGPGRYITIYAKGGHVFMSICGLRFDTSDMGAGRGDGPKWRPKSRSLAGYTMRHPPGL